MERLVSWAFWAFVVLCALTSLPWVLAVVPTGWLVVIAGVVVAGLYGRHERRRAG